MFRSVPFQAMQRNLMTFFFDALGICPLKWNPKWERFELCYVRYIYSVLLSLLLFLIDPICIVFVLDFLKAFDNVTLLTYVSFAEYLISYLVIMAIYFTQNWSPRLMVQMSNKCRSLYLAIDLDRRIPLDGFVAKRNVLSLFIGVIGLSVNVFCLNFLTETISPVLVVLASCVGSLPAVIITLFLVIYNTTLYVVLENFRQINLRLQALMNTLKGLVDQDADKPKGRVGDFRKLRSFCDISDQIDALAIFHKDIFNFLANFTSHCSGAMLMFALNVFCAIVSQAFFFYVNLAVMIRGSSNPTTSAVSIDLQFTGGLFYALMNATQLLFVIEATSAVIDTARSTGVQLHQVISASFDERLGRSVSSQLNNRCYIIVFHLVVGIILPPSPPSCHRRLKCSPCNC